MAEKETAKEVMDRMVLEPTLDEFNRRNPRDMTDEEFLNFVEISRRDRALYIRRKK